MIEIETKRHAPGSHVFQTAACGFILMIGTLGAAYGQTNSPMAEFETAPTTVLTMAPNGSWGAATNDFVGAAVVAAIADCHRRFRRATGCGAVQTMVRAGWSLGIRCDDKNILVAEKTLVEAEQAAIDQEVELRRQYGRDLPPCVRVVSVDPSGIVVAPYAAGLVGLVMRRRDGSSR
jgi:hypothetical protein